VTSTLAYNVDTKVRYTLATKLNSTRSVDFVESRLLQKVATNRQQSQLLPYTVDFVADMVNFVADMVNFVADTVNFVADTVNFVADTVNFVADTVNFVADTVNFVASVDGALLPVWTGPSCTVDRLSTKSTVLNST